jgi:hypothetical protein
LRQCMVDLAAVQRNGSDANGDAVTRTVTSLGAAAANSTSRSAS